MRSYAQGGKYNDKKTNKRKDPKEYMKLAVDVMKKSISERKKKNPSPYVGAVRKAIHKVSINELSKDELSAFEIFRNGKSLTKTEFAKQTGLSNRTAEKLLKKLTDLGLIKKRGSGPSTNYIINE